MVTHDKSELSGKLVVFNDNGIIRKLSACEVSMWSNKMQAWTALSIDDNGNYREDENGMPIKIYSTEVIDKPKRNKKPFVPTLENCTVEIRPEFKTEKAYALFDGTDGHVGRHVKTYYKYVAKSVCYVDDNGKIFAPVWAVK